MVNINSIEGIESLIDKRIKPLKEEILKLRFELEELNKAVTIPIVNNRIFECSKCGGKYELLAGELGCCTADDENSTSGMCGGELIEKLKEIKMNINKLKL